MQVIKVNHCSKNGKKYDFLSRKPQTYTEIHI